jgi:hypothetical protein
VTASRGAAAPPPALRCDECGQRLGKARGHLVTASQNLVCARCALENARRLHTKYYPDCPEDWHDVFDHHIGHATRAGAWFVLADPEKRMA